MPLLENEPQFYEAADARIRLYPHDGITLVQGEEIDLKSWTVPYHILHCLIRDPDKRFTGDELSEEILGVGDSSFSEANLRVQTMNLRVKFGVDDLRHPKDGAIRSNRLSTYIVSSLVEPTYEYTPDGDENVTFAAGGQLVVDRDKRRVIQDGHELDLTPFQYALLSRLSEDVGKVVSENSLEASIHGANPSPYFSGRLLSAHICNLRDRLGRDGIGQHGPDGVIETVIGQGYRLKSQ
jgi:DNA-binding response OmpR family regulator